MGDKKLFMFVFVGLLYVHTTNTSEEEDIETFNVDYSREVISINVYTFYINTTDEIHEDEITSEISGKEYVLENATITGIKNCTGEHVVYDVSWKNNSDTKLNFTMNCPRVVVQYKSKICPTDVDENGYGKCEIIYENESVNVTADIGENYKEIRDETHMTANDVTLVFKDHELPSNETDKAKYREPVFSAFLKKADLVSILF
ncbi:uncharacterized protein LOC135076281 isoform X1 [Ostrinia nubilalis]|uniref:uncharacterized protein LOC135076281 isoform X1 n=1 Tax=Ostrinia nubilalis TaxID=29057 RepID=UPI00308244D9